jgi:heparin/heparan-sulfate lyase
MENDRYIPPSRFIPDGIPIPPFEHPRLFLRHQHLATIRENAQHPNLKPIWERYVQTAEMPEIPSTLEAAKDMFLGNALLYLFEGMEASGRKAISAALIVLQRTVFPLEKQDISRDIGNLMLMGAIIYDWCYPMLNANEKEQFIGHFERLAALLETGYPPVPSSTVTGHAGEAMLIRDMLGAGIAIYDEKPDMYNFVCKIFFDEMVPARNYFYQSHTHHQGDSYGTTRYKWETFPLLMFDRMGFGSVYSDDHGEVPYYWIYIRRPDGLFIRGGDSYTSGDPKVPSVTKDTFFSYAAAYYKNPHFQYQHLWMFGNSPSVDPILDLILVDPHVKSEPPDNLPLTRYFGHPVGTMVARTGWRMGPDSPDVVAEMKVGTYYFANHQHLDAGNFQLYYKGDLAVDSGLYRGNGYNSEHVRNYHRRTIAHNCLLVYDPEETFPGDHANDGGQRMPNGRKELKRIGDLFEDNQTGEVVAHYIGPDPHDPELSYLKGDLTLAYSPDKVKEYSRSFAFLKLEDDLRPAVMVIFDRVVTVEAGFKKSWLLHTMEEPEIKGSMTIVRRTEPPYNGKMVNHTLLPMKGDVQIEKIGGKDKEFWVEGKNYPLKEPMAEAGSWRVEIRPVQPAKENLFLNVMQVMDNLGGPEPVHPERIEAEHVVGCRILGKAAIFSRSGRRLNEPFGFEISDNKEVCHIWLFDLAPGVWEVHSLAAGKASTMQREVTEEGTLRLEGLGGSYSLSMVACYP